MTHPPRDPRSLDALASCAPELAEAFVSLSGDIALVIDRQGVITRVAHSEGVPVDNDVTRWVGQRWVDTVSGDTRQKIEAMLTDLQTTGRARKREVTLSLSGGLSMPVAYTALQLGTRGPVIAVGRDMRAVAAIQQRFIDTQAELERGYWSTRHAEAHYELLFQVANDAVLSVAADGLRIVEANLAAPAVLAADAVLAERSLPEFFAPASRASVTELARRAAQSGQPAEVVARLASDQRAVAVAATPIRVDGQAHLLVRVHALRVGAGDAPEQNPALARLVDSMREGVVITDSAGMVLMANAPLARLVGEPSTQSLRQRPLGFWLGRVESDVSALLSHVHQHGIARLQRSSLRRSGRAAVDVDVCAVMLAEGDQERFGFTIWPRDMADTQRAAGVPLAAEAASELMSTLASLDVALGRESLPVLLERARVAVERHLVGVALSRTAGDAAAAAALLGVAPEQLQAMQSAAADPPSLVPGASA